MIQAGSKQHEEPKRRV